MKNYLNLALASAVFSGLTGCMPAEQSEIKLDTDQAVMSAEEKINYDKALDGENGMPAVGFPEQETSENVNPYETADTDLKKIIDSEKGQAALEAGKAAMIAGISAIDQDQVKAVAGSMIGQAGEITKKYADSAQAKIENSNTGSDLPAGWKTTVPSGIRFIDGDTIELKYDDGRQSDRVRLNGIDAPESSQEYGAESTQSLQSCMDNGQVTVRYKKSDQYGRLLGVVMAGDTDCNYNQVKVGSAWHYKQYQKEQPAGNAEKYATAENQARAGTKGLWANSNPQAPWSYRKDNTNTSDKKLRDIVNKALF